VSLAALKVLPWRMWFFRLGKFVLIALPIFLIWWVFQQVPFNQVWETLLRLEVGQITAWLVLNAALILLMTLRWWLVLGALGYPISNFSLSRYRLGSFAISYFTPGPQFGGEPFQVLALKQRHQVPGTTGTASVSLDKLLELIANFSFLVFGITIALLGAWFPTEWRRGSLLIALGLLVLPLAYLVSMLMGRQPLTWVVDRLPQKVRDAKLLIIIKEVEREMSQFCVTYPKTVFLASLVSIVAWIGLVFEYWLLTRYLGLRLTMTQSITALVAARLAFLTPLPGGLGALEASQVFALQALDIEPSFGVSIALLIRLRDILFGMFGLLGILPIIGWRLPTGSRKTKDV
jgi:uncharacterized protein (TIRG00374 family)